ncbi:hypothetical protein AWE51_23315 [Aquimarina aggregata]|uniref:Uncharacterized protein n=1 Tax=Aquimarina aggregata TaxID=1642818 RepID=A0A163B641_9FLAO|nr:hypothetical protein AWE51_23315 [Aquimarina aggregata]
MEKRKLISSGIKTKKYFWSWFVLFFFYIFSKVANFNDFWFFLGLTLSMFFFVLCLILKKVEYTSDFVYFNGKKTKFSDIKNLKVFEFNRNTYYLFITKSDSLFSKYNFTQLGLGKKVNFFALMKMLYSKTLEAELPLAEFFGLLKEKSEIKKVQLFEE